MARRSVTGCRLSLFAGLATVQALMFHLLAGGGMPHPALIAAASVLPIAVGLPGVWGGFSRWRLMAGLTVAEIGMHSLFSAGPGLGYASSSGHVHSLHDLLTGHACVFYTGAHLFTFDARYMLAAHLCSVALTAIGLTYGQTALEWVWASLTRVWTLSPRPLTPRTAGHRPFFAQITVVHQRWLIQVRSLRGPPVAALAL